MINEKEIKKQLEAKRKELLEIQQQYDQMRYSKQMKAVSDVIIKSPDLLKIIVADKLNADDAGLFAQKITFHINGIYGKYREEILLNQTKRISRNQARKSRRNKPNATKLQEKKPVHEKAKPQPDMTVPAPAKPVVAKDVVTPAKPVVVKDIHEQHSSHAGIY